MSMTPQPVDHLISLARALETAHIFLFFRLYSLMIVIKVELTQLQGQGQLMYFFKCVKTPLKKRLLRNSQNDEMFKNISERTKGQQ